MKTIFEAAHVLEAQLLCDWLQQSGIHARVEGSYLQGGIGELQAMGVVRVVVDEADYHLAKEALHDWDRLHGRDSQGNHVQRAQRVASLGRHFLSRIVLILGAVVLVLLMVRLLGG